MARSNQDGCLFPQVHDPFRTHFVFLILFFETQNPFHLVSFSSLQPTSLLCNTPISFHG
ncbi:unnamed protein product [Prunus brigantina]